MRGKIVEEINRIIRQNRYTPNVTVYDFVGLGPDGQGCKALSGDTEAAPIVPSGLNYPTLLSEVMVQ